jgi:hypothetical protein
MAKAVGKITFDPRPLKVGAQWQVVATYASRAFPKFESYATFETAAFCGSKSNAATERFHGIARLV